MGNNWTNEQLEAIRARNCNLLVAAAAGAGKTAVLVERIIKRIMDEDDPIDIDSLLVVTFTNAAASEMREKIGDALSKALDENPNSRRLQNQLTLLNKSNIMTIHSFCLDVIRSNFHRIDLDPGFRIGDGTETTLLKQDALEELFEEMYGHDGKKDDFTALVESYGGTRGDLPLQDIVLSLHSFAKSFPYPEKWLLDMAERFNIGEDFNFTGSEIGRVIVENIKISLKTAVESMKRAIEIIRNTEELEVYMDNFNDELLTIENIYNSCDGPWEELIIKFENFKPQRLKAAKKADEETKKKVKGLRDNAKRIIKDIKDNILRWNEEELSRQIKALYPPMKSLSELIIDFDKKYTEKKRERGIIDFNDIEHLCLNILVNEDNNPSDIALSYRERFNEILIDEYQDSNLVQETILSSISRQDPPNMFMVGDVKQSIYRFRQAKPELFLEKYNSYSRDKNSKYRKITLYKNFRSRMEVIEGVNFIFKQIMSEHVGELEYTDEERLNLGAEYPEVKDENIEVGGEVELHLIEKNTVEEETLGEEDSEEEETLNNIQLEARVVVKRIKSLINIRNGKQFNIYDKREGRYRKVEYRDIAILLRATAKWADVFLDELTKAGIPAFADTGVGYFETIEIKTILSLLQVIDNPMQDIPLIAVLKSPVFSFTPDELVDVRMSQDDGTFYEALKKVSEGEYRISKKAKSVIDSIVNWQYRARYMSIDELIWYLYTTTGYYGYVGAMKGGVQRQANLRILFERAKEYEDTSYKGLFNFINFINKLRVSSGDMGSAKILGENENVVRIMSIHKSKGLEFPVVIVSGMGKKFNKMDLRRKILYHHRLGFGPDFVDYKRRITYSSIAKEAVKNQTDIESISEEMRILYVAFTRAREKLIITGTINEIEKSALKWSHLTHNNDVKLSEYDVLKAQSYLDWIAPCLMRHPDCMNLRGYGKLDYDDTFEDEVSRWNVTVWKRSEVIEAEEKQEEREDVGDRIKNIDITQYESNWTGEIARRLEYVYPFEASKTLPAKLSVSEVKRISRFEDMDEDALSMFRKTVLKKPTFLETRSGLSGAERGTLMHLAMQHINLRPEIDFEYIESQMKSLAVKEIINEEELKYIDINKIERFFNSSIGVRMLSSKNVRREVPFHITLPATEVYKGLDDKYTSEYIMVQGIIDCVFEEGDDLILLDYKTDYVSNIEDIKEKYDKQIELYTRALEIITGKNVKDKYIYMFHNDKVIEY